MLKSIVVTVLSINSREECIAMLFSLLDNTPSTFMTIPQILQVGHAIWNTLFFFVITEADDGCHVHYTILFTVTGQ